MRNISLRAALLAIVCLCIDAATSAGQWTQFGGPKRNFSVDSADLADHWPASGPRKLWDRDLGDGYSTICVDGDRLYTMYGADGDEYVVSLDAKTGRTIWEHKYPVELDRGMVQYGAGPHATPLIVRDRLFTIGVTMRLFCFDKKTGKVLWEHDLAKEYGGTVPGWGYSASPIAYKDTVILPVGSDDAKERQALMAFAQSDGAVVWKNQRFTITHASPILITFGGRTQLVVFMASELAGLDPNNGDLIWSQEHKTQYGGNLCTPLWNGDDLIFCSAAYDSGGQVVRLRKQGKNINAQEVWFSKKLRIHHGNALHIGDRVVGSSGDFGPAFLTAIDFKTGEVVWRERGFSKATCIYADDKIIILDEDGTLALATVKRDKLNVLSQCQIAEKVAWTSPTLVGKTLYLRDRKRIMALDLG